MPPTFEAKEASDFRHEASDQPKPGHKVPQASVEHLRPLGANEFFPRFWQYLHEQHSFEDFRRPGYFDADPLSIDSPREHLRVGDQIFYTLCGGSKLPSEWARGIATVLEIPNTKELPLVLAGIVEYPQPTPWRGEVSDSKGKLEKVGLE